MNLLDVHQTPGSAGILWQLLQERQQHQCISHREMPDWHEHTNFVEGKPYEVWYLIEVEGLIRGACYLTKKREIGVGILEGERGNGYAEGAVRLLMELSPGKFTANINSANFPSVALFEKLGFVPTQVVYTK